MHGVKIKSRCLHHKSLSCRLTEEVIYIMPQT